MQIARRAFVNKGLLATLALFVAPLRAMAAEWNRVAFESTKAAEAIKAIGADNARPTADIQIRAPEIAENGGVVPIEVSSTIPGTRSLAIIADRNPFPLLAVFSFAPRAESYASTRVKLAQTSTVRAFATAADGKVYVATASITVTVGGCGG